jgi:hypothetical protein
MKNGLNIIKTILIIIVFGLDGNTQTTDVSGMSPIFGSSPIQVDIGLSSTLKDPNWGIVPSRQNVNTDIWGRTISNTQKANKQAVHKDIAGRIIAIDNTGNILYDAHGQIIVDTTILNSNDPLLDPPSINIPDDPIDTPLDGGVVALVAIAIIIGYMNKGNADKQF